MYFSSAGRYPLGRWCDWYFSDQSLYCMCSRPFSCLCGCYSPVWGGSTPSCGSKAPDPFLSQMWGGRGIILLPKEGATEHSHRRCPVGNVLCGIPAAALQAHTVPYCRNCPQPRVSCGNGHLPGVPEALCSQSHSHRFSSQLGRCAGHIPGPAMGAG